jgi:hypothetical protein
LDIQEALPSAREWTLRGKLNLAADPIDEESRALIVDFEEPVLQGLGRMRLQHLDG